MTNEKKKDGKTTVTKSAMTSSNFSCVSNPRRQHKKCLIQTQLNSPNLISWSLNSGGKLSFWFLCVH